MVFESVKRTGDDLVTWPGKSLSGWQMRRKFLALGILILNACTSTQATRVAPVDQARLRDTVKIDVMELKAGNVEPAVSSCRTNRLLNVHRGLLCKTFEVDCRETVKSVLDEQTYSGCRRRRAAAPQSGL